MGRGLGSHLDPGDAGGNVGNRPKYNPSATPSRGIGKHIPRKSPPSHGDIDVKAFFPFPCSHGLPRALFSSPAAVVSSLGQAGELSPPKGAFCFLGIPALGGWRLKQALFFVLRAPTSHHAGRRRLVAPEPQGTIQLLLIVSGMTALGFRVNGRPTAVGRLIMFMRTHCPEPAALRRRDQRQ